MSHPCVVTLDAGSRPRVLFAGDRLVEVELPAGSRVLYPKPPLPALPDVEAALTRALNNPAGSEALHSKLRPGMKVTLAIDDVAVPLPGTQQPDVRQRVLHSLLQLLADHAVEDVEIVIASGLRRRMKPHEVRRMVGERIFNAYWPTRLYNLDPENPASMTLLGHTAQGEPVELSKRAADSDLLISLSVSFVPSARGYEPVVVGLSSYQTQRCFQNPNVLATGASSLDPAGSELASCIERMGKLVSAQLDVFSIQITLNNRMWGKPLSALGKNEDDLTATEWSMLRATVRALGKLPQAARQAVFERVPANYEVTGIFAGDPAAANAHSLALCERQYLVPVDGQADVLVTGIPHLSPFNVGAMLNPLLVSVMAQGYLFNMYRGAPLVKPGGTLIITHPCTDRFDHEQHAPYIDFVHQLLHETRDSWQLQQRYEEKFAKNPAFLAMFRQGHAQHPAQPFFMWYWGEAARRHLGKVIVVGADNEYIPKLLGFETARNVSDALYRARGGESVPQSIMCLHLPPVVMGDLRVSSAVNGVSPGALT